MEGMRWHWIYRSKDVSNNRYVVGSVQDIIKLLKPYDRVKHELKAQRYELT
jgi:hypothetical protein